MDVYGDIAPAAIGCGGAAPLADTPPQPSAGSVGCAHVELRDPDRDRSRRARRPAARAQRTRFVPIVVGEIIAGILVGPEVLSVVDPANAAISFLGQVGFAMLMLTVGMHLPLHNARLARSLRGGGLLAAIVAALAIPAGLLAAAIAGTPHAAIYAVLLASGSAAVLLRIGGGGCDGARCAGGDGTGHDRRHRDDPVSPDRAGARPHPARAARRGARRRGRSGAARHRASAQRPCVGGWNTYGTSQSNAIGHSICAFRCWSCSCSHGLLKRAARASWSPASAPGSWSR